MRSRAGTRASSTTSARRPRPSACAASASALARRRAGGVEGLDHLLQPLQRRQGVGRIVQGQVAHQIEGAVSSSDASTAKLKSLGIHVFDSNEVDSLDIYVDGADEINGHMQMIKGGGAALTREKIIAAIAKKFICIVDASKQVDVLGKFPLPVEVIPMARSYVARELVKLGGLPEYRQNVVTDNGNVILDVHNLSITDAIALENKINGIAGGYAGPGFKTVLPAEARAKVSSIQPHNW